jgi:hypothetical protein
MDAGMMFWYKVLLNGVMCRRTRSVSAIADGGGFQAAVSQPASLGKLFGRVSELQHLHMKIVGGPAVLALAAWLPFIWPFIVHHQLERYRHRIST